MMINDDYNEYTWLNIDFDYILWYMFVFMLHEAYWWFNKRQSGPQSGAFGVATTVIVTTKNDENECLLVTGDDETSRNGITTNGTITVKNDKCYCLFYKEKTMELKEAEDEDEHNKARNGQPQHLSHKNVHV